MTAEELFGRFLGAFTVTAPPSKHGQPPVAPGKAEPNGYSLLMGDFEGATFDSGLYRLKSIPEIPRWNDIVGAAFPEYAKRISCFGWDWLGRHFALDSERIEGGEPLILMLEPGTGEVLEIPTNFIQFHNSELVDSADAALARDFYIRWRKMSGVRELTSRDCVGYKVPLFLGGADTPENLEVIDAEVYWAMCGQLRLGTRHLPAGSTVRSIAIT